MVTNIPLMMKMWIMTKNKSDKQTRIIELFDDTNPHNFADNEGRFVLYKDDNDTLHYLLVTKHGIITRDYPPSKCDYWNYEPNCTHAAIGSMNCQAGETWGYSVNYIYMPKRSKDIYRINKCKYEELLSSVIEDDYVYQYKDGSIDERLTLKQYCWK